MKSSLRESLPYRDCVGIVVFNALGQIFIGRRIFEKDLQDSRKQTLAWQMPQGGIDKGEAPRQAAERELLEETSIESIRLLGETEDWIYYDLPDELVGVAWKGRYRGQRLRWFAFEFTGDESEIDVTTPNQGKSKAEFAEWRWEDPEKLPDLIVAFKKEMYQRVIAAFSDVMPAQSTRG